MALSQELTTPTADAETTDTSAGTAPAAPAAQTATPTPAPNGRTYSQTEMDSAAAWYRKSLREERERLERQYQPRRTETTPPADPARDSAAQFVKQQFESLMAPFRKQMTETELDRTIAAFAKEAPEFADQAKLSAILDIAVEKGLDRRTDLSIPEVLNLAHYFWIRTQPKQDIEAIKKQAADEAIKAYTTKKADTSASTPRTVGTGGTAPVTGKKTTKKADFEAAISAAVDRIK